MWRQLTVTVDEALADPLSDALAAAGALSVSFEDAGDQPLFEPKPGETPVWQRTRVTALFDRDIDTDPVRDAIEARFPGKLAGWESTELEDRAWERAWLDHFKPMRFGRRLWICPSGFEPPEPEAVNVLLDPGLAFGTGTHPTTALCLEWLEGLSLAGKTVLDYGCGSGILAVAALKLGAERAVGVDIDPQALTASAENARRNSVEERLGLFVPRTLPPGFRADILVANILATPLIELAADIAGSVLPGGHLALSGILAEQAEAVRRAYQPWIGFAPPVQREDWILLSGLKAAG
jgi:ribosomal protein L11 methyltransferase